MQLGDRAVRDVPGAARGRRHQRDHRRAPRPAADERAHGHDGPAGAHPGAGAADAAASPRSASRQNEEFMWRLADRQLDEFLADGRCEFISAVLPAVRHARRRRPPRRARVGPPAVPRGLRARRPTPGELGGDEGRPGAQRARRGSTTTSRRTSRTAAASRAPTCSPTWRSPSTPTARRPRSRRSCARRRSCSPPARRRRARLLATALKYLAEYPELQDELRDAPRPHPRLHRGGAADREPGQGRLPPRPTRRDDRWRRHRSRARR